MVRQKIVFLIGVQIFLYLTNGLKSQSITYQEYKFNKDYYYNHCNFFSFQVNGTNVNYTEATKKNFLFNYSVLQAINCNIDSFHACEVYTPTIDYMSSEYFNAKPEQKIKKLNFFYRDCIMQANSFNNFINRLTKLNTLVLNIQSPLFSDTIISHLFSGIVGIDSLVINDMASKKHMDSITKMTFPIKFPFFDSVRYLKITSQFSTLIPNYIFEPKPKPLNTLVFVCDTLRNLDKLTKLSSLKSLAFINTKEMDLLMPKILKLDSLEELYIAETDLSKIPKELLELPNLKTLVIVNNNNLNNFPKSIQKYENLQHFMFFGGRRKARKFATKIYHLSKLNPKKYNNY